MEDEFKYKVPQEEVEAFEKPGGGLEKYKAKVKEISRLFSELDDADQKACLAMANRFLDLDKEREVRLKEDLATESEIMEEQAEENVELTNHIANWFPSLGSLSEREQHEYAVALLEHISKKRDIH